jgi:hypothetical protein
LRTNIGTGKEPFVSKKKILIVGLDPNKIQFGIERRLTPENVIAAGRATEDKLVSLELLSTVAGDRKGVR